MRTRYDQFGKQLVHAAFAARGAVATEVEVPAEPRSIDVCFTPNAATAHVSADHLGLLGRIAAGPITLEFFHNTPDGDTLAACLIKHGQFRHHLSQREAPPATPTQWVISSGRPEAGIAGLWLRPMATWAPRFYEAPPLLWTRLVVVNELPVARDTLLVRLLGAGAVLKQAIAELKDLPSSDPEPMIALPILVRLRLTMPDDPAKRTNDDKEFLVDTQDIVDNWRREAVQEGLRQNIELVTGALIMLYEARFGGMTKELRDIVEATRDKETLSAWVQLFGTRGADEIAAALRATIAS